jgi:hypothetical protein
LDRRFFFVHTRTLWRESDLFGLVVLIFALATLLAVTATLAAVVSISAEVNKLGSSIE